MSKMKVGDLVMLSQYGRDRDYNRKITSVDPNQIGLIISEEHKSWSYPFKVKWMKTPYTSFGPSSHMRRELKFAHAMNSTRK